jgi:hypothetical protein
VFGALSAAEADAWRAERAPGAAVGREATLAELFAVADGRAVAPARPSLGFTG